MQVFHGLLICLRVSAAKRAIRVKWAMLETSCSASASHTHVITTEVSQVSSKMLLPKQQKDEPAPLKQCSFCEADGPSIPKEFHRIRCAQLKSNFVAIAAVADESETSLTATAIRIVESDRSPSFLVCHPATPWHKVTATVLGLAVEPKPVMPDAAITDDAAATKYSSDVEGWGDRRWAAIARLCWRAAANKMPHPDSPKPN